MDRKPEWLRVPLPSGERWRRLSGLVERRGLHTVCDSARCPNKAECWGSGTATFMILGGTCTRNCRYCAVPTARLGEPVLAAEAEQLAEAVAELGLSFAVITSVDRDDLADRGAAHFAACVRAIKARNPGVGVEVLCPDYREGEIEAVLDAAPTVFAHNVETVPRLQGIRDARASWEASVRTLRLAAADGRALVKSSLLLGLGETRDEVLEAMDLLLESGARSLVLGQYLRPSPAQVAVREYIDPTVFAELAARAKEKGFTAVVSGPLVRTSYHARESSGHATRVLSASGAQS